MDQMVKYQKVMQKWYNQNFPKYFFEILDWASDRGKICIKANADTTKEAVQAKGFKVDGIGLCRTEHMFFEKNLLQIMQKILFVI